MANWRSRVSYIGLLGSAVLLPALVALEGCGSASGNTGAVDSGNGGASTPASSGGTTGNDTGAGGGPSGRGSSGAGGSADAGGFGSLQDGSVSDAAPAEKCTVAGSTRSCCGTAQQTCMGMEFPVWGPCLDSKGAMVTCGGPCGLSELHPCDASVPPPPMDAGPCGPGFECIPGSIRWCDNPIANWSLSTCDQTGHWGNCVAHAGIPGCGSNYAPDTCCTSRHLCCQWEVNGPFVDFGGACAALSCQPLGGGGG
jgi:hypothetical protein